MVDSLSDRTYLATKDVGLEPRTSALNPTIDFLQVLTRSPANISKEPGSEFQLKLANILGTVDSNEFKMRKAGELMQLSQSEILGAGDRYLKDGLLANVMKESFTDMQNLDQGTAIFLLFSTLGRKNKYEKIHEHEQWNDYRANSVVIQQLMSKFMLTHTPEEFGTFVNNLQSMTHFLSEVFIKDAFGKEEISKSLVSMVRGSVGTLGAACLTAGITNEPPQLSRSFDDQLYGIDVCTDSSVGQSKFRSLSEQRVDNINPFSTSVRRETDLFGRKQAQIKPFFMLPVNRFQKDGYEMLFEVIRFVPVKDAQGNVHKIEVESIGYDPVTSKFNSQPQPSSVLEEALLKFFSSIPEQQSYQALPPATIIREVVSKMSEYSHPMKEWLKDILLALKAAEIDPDLRKKTSQIFHVQSDLHQVDNKHRPEDLREYAIGSLKVIDMVINQFGLDTRMITSG